MAYCDVCGSYDDEHTDGMPEYQTGQDYQPELYYYYDGDFCVEDYNWREAEPEAECLCEICFDILNTEGKIKWQNDENPFKCASINSGTS